VFKEVAQRTHTRQESALNLRAKVECLDEHVQIFEILPAMFLARATKTRLASLQPETGLI
jgi:hypothetical protein